VSYRTDNRKYVKLLKLLAAYDTLFYRLGLAKSSASEQDAEAQRLMTQFEPEYAEVFVDATEELRSNTSTAAMERGLREGDNSAIFSAIPLAAYTTQLIGFTPVSVQSLQQTGALAAREIRSQTRQAFLFDISQDNAQRYLQQHGAALIRDVSNETRQAIQGAILRANQDGLSSRSAAREIRGLVGLTDRDTQAVQSLRARMVAAGNTPAQIERTTRAKTNQLLRRRAGNIARTESATAVGDGRQQAWQQAINEGVVDATKATKSAMAAIDNRTSLLCRNIDGSTVPINQPFETIEGPQDTTPFHASCRTSITMSAKGKALRGPNDLEQNKREYREAQKRLREIKPKRKPPKPPAKKKPRTKLPSEKPVKVPVSQIRAGQSSVTANIERPQWVSGFQRELANNPNALNNAAEWKKFTTNYFNSLPADQRMNMTGNQIYNSLSDFHKNWKSGSSRGAGALFKNWGERMTGNGAVFHRQYIDADRVLRERLISQTSNSYLNRIKKQFGLTTAQTEGMRNALPNWTYWTNQSAMRQASIPSGIRLYRGLSYRYTQGLRTAYSQAGRSIKKLSGIIRLEQNPAQSWTASQTIARRFSRGATSRDLATRGQFGALVSQDVRRSEVVLWDGLSPLYGSTHTGQQEYVTLSSRLGKVKVLEQ